MADKTSKAFLFDPITGNDARLQEIPAGDVDLGNFVLDVVNNTKEIKDYEVSNLIIDGEVHRTMDGASNLTVNFSDPLGKLLNSGAFERAIQVELDGLLWRLVAVNKNDDQLQVVFEDRDVTYIREHKEVVTVSRKKLTRAEFCAYLLKRVKKRPFTFVCPELHKTQPIEKTTKTKKEVKDRRRELGIPDDGDFHIYYADGDVRPATNAQIDLIEQILDVGSKKKGITNKVLISAVEVVMIESGAKNLTAEESDDGSVGAFQQRKDQGWTGLDDVQKAASEYFDSAIRYESTHSGVTSGDIAAAVQRPKAEYRGRYAKAAKYAKEFVDAYGSSDLTSSVAYRKQFNFSTKNGGKAEDWWTAIGRLMEDVGWARFMSNGVLYMIAEKDLLKSRIRMKLSEQTPGVERINFNYDVGQTIANATITCRADRWVAPPGTVVELSKCGPANGRWLVQDITRPLFSKQTTIVLKKPTKKLPEPASELVLRENADENISEHHGSGKYGGQGPLKNKGKIYFAPGANATGRPLRKPLTDFLKEMATYTSEQVMVNFGTNHSQFTVNGGVSEHFTGDAADLNVDGDARTSDHALNKGNNLAIAAMRACGLSYAEAKAHIGDNILNFSQDFHWTDGNNVQHRVQIGWRTFSGGNHYNHVHVGVHFG